ncbi:MAG: sensor histidine kinase [Pseudomonadota bacterium]
MNPELRHLVESRARLVACSDATRAELGRMLHDGPQQRVVGVSLLLHTLRRRIDEGEALALIDQAVEELARVGAELRDLAGRLHPVALTERGLRPALFAATTRAAIPVELEVPEERLPAEVERAAYDVVLSAIESAGEDDASHVRVSLARGNGSITLEVADDGRGGADPGCARLCALADRVETVGGRLELESPTGGGTRIRARFPVGA